MTTQATDQITHTLQSLLPSFTSSSRSRNTYRGGSDGSNGSFPAPLVQLTLALLQRSRARVPSLKPGEEVGRCFVVAEIACNRLKTRLNLPAIESRPPCPPKVYKKLYAYLESVLKDEKKSAEDAAEDISVNAKSSASKKKGSSHHSRNPAASPSTNRSAVTPSKAPPTGTRRLHQELPVRSPPSMKRSSEPAEVNGGNPASASKRRKLDKQPNELNEPNSNDADELADEDEGGSTSQSEGEEFVDADEFVHQGEEDDNSAELVHAGGHSRQVSLMESRFDWLSDERRQDFAQWKAKTLKKIDEMENSQGKSKTKVRSKGIAA